MTHLYKTANQTKQNINKLEAKEGILFEKYSHT